MYETDKRYFKPSDLYREYLNWCMENGEKSNKMKALMSYFYKKGGKKISWNEKMKDESYGEYKNGDYVIDYKV